MVLYKKALRLSNEGVSFAFAVVMRASGSTPQKAGAKALFERSGKIHGTLGGGCLEAEARRRALDALDSGKPIAFDLSLNDDFGWDDGLICGGSVRILVEPRPELHRNAFENAAIAVGRGERGALLFQHRVEGHIAVHWIAEAGIESYCPYPGSAALCAALQSAEPAWFEEKDADGNTIAEVYIEPIEPTPLLLIAGGGHIGQAVARLGSWLGFDVTVIDDRPQFTDTALYPDGVQTICGDIAKHVAEFPIHASTYIVIATRGHRHDGIVLKECIHSPAPYIGMIGSKRKAHIVRKGLLDEGHATPEEFDRVASPIGLDIGALTVEEIAVSIMSQLVAVRRNHTGAAQPLNVYAPA